MSAGTALATPDESQPRHRLINFTSQWRRTQTMVFYGAAVLLIGTGVTYATSHKFYWDYVLLGALLVLLGFGIRFGSRRYYVQLTPEGLLLNGVFRHQLIPFQEIRQVRSQPLQVLFAAPSRRGLLHRTLRQFGRLPACILRLDLEPAQVAQLGKAAGRGCAVDQDLILLVSDAKGLERDLQSRIRRRPPAAAARRR